MGLAVFAAASFAISVLACWFVRRFAERRHLVDRPNERSLHQVPTPRLGGVAIVATVIIVLAASVLVWCPTIHRDLSSWAIGAIIIALLGLIDDLRSLPSLVRFLVQIAVAAMVVANVAESNFIVLTIAVVGLLNIYNFMDGMDGLAGSQAVGAATTLAVASLVTQNFDVAAIALVIAGASAGFLAHNSPPASLFLGDAGSTFLGFTFGILGIVLASRPHGVPLVVTAIALSPFLLDGTFTIVRRALRGEAIWRAHRSHLYQRAVTSGLLHRDVLLVYATWIACAGAAALLAIDADSSHLVGISAAMCAALVAIWIWVVRRESRLQ